MTHLIDLAGGRGADFREAFQTEFGEDPDRLAIGDWDSEAWGSTWADLCRAGATEGDHDTCRDAWEKAFFEDEGSLVCGCQVQVDLSGVGHNWVNEDAWDLNPDVLMQIECEIIDGGRDECGDFVALNGLHYRWS